MFDRTEIRLASYNVAVFAGVLIVFASIIYGSVVQGLYQDQRSDMTHLVDSIIASIDFDEDKRMHPDSAVPDLIESVLPESASQSLNTMNLQWFDRKGH